jgi:hypothetical protein
MFEITGFRIEQGKIAYHSKAKNLDELSKKSVIALEKRRCHFVGIRAIGGDK